MKYKLKPIKIAVLVVSVSLLGACNSVTTNNGRSISPGNAKKAAEANYELALAYVSEGQNQVAQAKLIKAINLDPTYYEAYNALGALYEDAQAYDLAAQAYRQAAKKPGYTLAKLNYARLLCTHSVGGTESIRQAAQIYNTMSAKGGAADQAAARVGAGVCYARAQQWETAEQTLQQALAMQPEMPSALYEMAQVLQMQGKNDMAAIYLQRYVAQAGQDDRALKMAALLGISL